MRYEKDDPYIPIFSLPSNGHCNNIIRNIMNRIGIDKRVTFHSARHTFATTITLANGVSIEAVSKMLGHADIKTTQIYAKTLRSTVSSEMHRISPCIDSSFTSHMLMGQNHMVADNQ
jgi:integrase